jgi:ABC-type transporter Mla maintaining outer membrane lipid asymmetry ATPase subunit MlaF
MPALIELKDLSCCAEDGSVVFDSVDLKFSGGEKVILTGPLGSGKGRFVRMLAGVVPPVKGKLFLFGTDTSGLDMDELNVIRRRMGFVLQESTLISNLKVLENAALPLLYHSDLSQEECMERALKLLGRTGYKGGLWDLPAHLPLHSKKEVAVARALALAPEIVVCENISSGLTDDEKERMAGFLTDYHGAMPGRLLIVSSNADLDMQLYEPDRVVRIVDRKLVG